MWLSYVFALWFLAIPTEGDTCHLRLKMGIALLLWFYMEVTSLIKYAVIFCISMLLGSNWGYLIWLPWEFARFWVRKDISAFRLIFYLLYHRLWHRLLRIVRLRICIITISCCRRLLSGLEMVLFITYVWQTKFLVLIEMVSLHVLLFAIYIELTTSSSY